MEEYINKFDGITRRRLEELYELIKSVLPEAKEKISYGVPTFYNDAGYIVYFAGYKDFVSVYPVHQAENLIQIVQPFLSGKSTARFYNNLPLPKQLIEKIVAELDAVNRTRDNVK